MSQMTHRTFRALALALGMSTALTVAAPAMAGDLSFTADTTLTVGAMNFTIRSGSVANEIQVIDSTSFLVSVTNPDSFRVTSDERRAFTNNSVYGTACGSTSSDFIVQPLSGTAVVTVTPGAQDSCATSGGGGGGGGGAPLQTANGTTTTTTTAPPATAVSTQPTATAPSTTFGALPQTATVTTSGGVTAVSSTSGSSAVTVTVPPATTSSGKQLVTASLPQKFIPKLPKTYAKISDTFVSRVQDVKTKKTTKDGRLLKRVTLTIAISADQLKGLKANKDLVIAVYDSRTRKWNSKNTRINAVTGEVSTNTNQVGVYAVMKLKKK